MFQKKFPGRILDFPGYLHWKNLRKKVILQELSVNQQVEVESKHVFYVAIYTINRWQRKLNAYHKTIKPEIFKLGKFYYKTRTSALLFVFYIYISLLYLSLNLTSWNQWSGCSLHHTEFGQYNLEFRIAILEQIEHSRTKLKFSKIALTISGYPGFPGCAWPWTRN